MLNIFQELIPFSNKRLDKAVSGDGAYSNPIIMPFAFDFTVCSNMLETVLYIRNDSQVECYSNIVVTLMKEDASVLSPVVVNGTIATYGNNDLPGLTINGTQLPLGYSIENPIIAAPISITGAYRSNYIPVLSDIDPDSGNVLATDGKLGVKFNYGYDELSTVDWLTRHSALCIPNIGYKSSTLIPFGSPDTSYHPVRMRLTWKAQSTLLTIRDYFIDVSYGAKETI